MKVLHVGKSSRIGGAAIASYRLMEALKENGLDVKLLVQEDQGNGGSVYSTTHSALKRGINFLRFITERLCFLRHERNKEVRFLFSLANTGEQLIRNKHVKEADLIHLHWVNAGFLSLHSLKKLLATGKPVVWTFHDMWAITGGCHHAVDCEQYKLECGNCPYLRNPGKKDLSHRLWKKKSRVFRNSQITVITPSRWLHDRVKESSLFSGMKVHAIPNGVDQAQFMALDREDACRQLELDPSRRYILFGAASVKNLYKGFGYFQEAIQKLKLDKKAPGEVEILLFGKTGNEVSDMLPLKTHSFNYVDSTETMLSLYSVAHLYVISSLQDTFPTTVMESMFCGTPVVGFRTGGIPEMITHHESGYLAEHKSVEDLVRGIQWALSIEHSEALRARVRKEAIQNFSRERSAEMHVELYQELLKSQRK